MVGGIGAAVGEVGANIHLHVGTRVGDALDEDGASVLIDGTGDCQDELIVVGGKSGSVDC